MSEELCAWCRKSAPADAPHSEGLDGHMRAFCNKGCEFCFHQWCNYGDPEQAATLEQNYAVSSLSPSTALPYR
jgi:hypothetical protein